MIRAVVVRIDKPRRRGDRHRPQSRPAPGGRGFVQVISMAEHREGTVLWCNEEGFDLPLNRRFTAHAMAAPAGAFVIKTSPLLADPGELGIHHIHGDFFITRAGDGDAGALTEDIAYYMQFFSGGR